MTNENIKLDVKKIMKTAANNAIDNLEFDEFGPFPEEKDLETVSVLVAKYFQRQSEMFYTDYEAHLANEIFKIVSEQLKK